ncbi:MAG: 4-alpha-glucanotransferase, partial [Novosphingobium sp.]|nr:4-alpha-glucanotransferase [Novosphingobium sp.]
PPPDPHALAAGGYDAFAELLAANMAYAGALRIDHAMALSRLFWVPDRAEGKDGAYVSYPLGDLLGETALASVRARCLVVAEAFGTVPEGFAEALAEADMLSYRVLLLEREGEGYRPPADYPQLSLACVTSHDLPPFAGWWQGADIAERAELGLVTELSLACVTSHDLPPFAGWWQGADIAERAELGLVTDVVGAEAARESDREALLRNVAGDVADLAGVNTAVHAAVAVGASALAMVQAEELALEERSVNMPGTDRERPNWRRRLAVIVDRLFTGEGGALLARVRALRQAGSGSR